MVWLLILTGLLALLPLVVSSNFLIGLLIVILFSAYLGQAWNILGGLCGQFSLGHASFFGIGLYVSLILQVDFKIHAWAAFGLAGVAGALVALFIGGVSFRYGLRGSYFALVTLAFSEALRVIASVLTITGGGTGKILPTKVGIEHLQFPTKVGFFYFALVLFFVGQAVAVYISRSRLGARFAAIREDEEAAAALGVNLFRHKVIAITISGALTGAGGAFYGQYYVYSDPLIAFGPLQSVEMLLVPIIGGMGTLMGPVLGATVLRVAAEFTQEIVGNAPGINLVLYGIVVIGIVKYAPDGLHGGVRFAVSYLRRRFGAAFR